MTTVFGEKLKIELYGKSHGPNVGIRIDGVPEGLSFDVAPGVFQLFEFEYTLRS